ncbi:ClpP-like prohead protease/major capsid protein fusion protein [Yoonia sp. 208BN28-4]|uniref:ClpP-like prohead protease/major capsid protein fusion protein n=1 Tax=Yoonia sp. 208BN28-4 TaxID=3126505 RepID=UPI0030B316CB
MKNEIYLYGSVGADFWDEDFFTARDVIDQLADMTGDITVRINSGGGIATEGQAIFNHLRDYDGQVDVVIDGAAASAASLIAMAGDTITMRSGSWMMIHDPAQWMIEGRGTEDDHLRAASGLRVAANAYAKVYAARAEITVDEARQIMKDETWYEGEAAVAAGFATHHEDQAATVAAVFDYGMYAHAPDGLASSTIPQQSRKSKPAILAMMAGQTAPKQKGKTMPKQTMADDQTDKDVKAMEEDEDETTTAAGAVDDDEGDDKTTAADDQDQTDDEDDETPVAAQIVQLGITLDRPAGEAAELIASGATLAHAADHWNAQKRKENPMSRNTTRGAATAKSQQPTDARDKFKAGAAMALMAKVGIDGGERNEFSSMSLSEMARHAIEMTGHRGGFNDRLQMIGHAFTMEGTHTTSDFANVLSNVMGKAALLGYEEAEETFPIWTSTGQLTNFQPSKRVGLDVFSALPKVEEGADYTYGTFGDRGENITLATYGKLLRISRQAIINDDLSILGTAPRRMGRAAKRTIGNLVYAVLTGNPAMSDGKALFHASRSNLATGAGSVLGVDSLSTGEAAMMTQKDGAAKDASVLNIQPAYLIVPAALKRSAKTLMESAVDPRDAKGHSNNPVSGMAEVVADGRLDAASKTAWYLAGSPSSTDTIEVAYLDGNDAPYLEEQTAWHSDGVEMKVRIDAGVAPLGPKALYKANGA